MAAHLWRLAPGLALALGIALFSFYLSSIEIFAAWGLGVLTFSIILGMAVGNGIYSRIEARALAGVGFSKHWLLRAGIVLYGLRLTFQDVAHVGFAGAAVDALMILSCFMLALWAGKRIFGMESGTAALVGIGSSICGAAAVLGAAPVIKARPDQASVAVSTVVAFGTLAMFLYPAAAGALFAIFETPERVGIYLGSTIHEIAQVAAAGKAISPAVADIAVVAKMVRVMMLAPVLLILAFFWRAPGKEEGGARGKIQVPWFAFGFIAVVALHSMIPLPEAALSPLLWLDTLFLAMAMGALGVTTRFSEIRKAGAEPMMLAALLFVWLVAGGGALNYFIMTAFG